MNFQFPQMLLALEGVGLMKLKIIQNGQLYSSAIENGQFYCFRCQSDYEPGDDYKSYIEFELFHCSYITGCHKCDETTEECIE